MLAPELRTERLVLRAWRDDDLAPFAALNADARVMEHFPSALSRAESDALAARIRAFLDEHAYGLWAVEIPGELAFAGFVGLWHVPTGVPFDERVEVGWRLAPAAWGRGIATEAARASLAHGFDALGLDAIVSFTVAANRRSWRVMERLGMELVPGGAFSHPRLPRGHRLERHLRWRLSRAAWDARRR